MHYVDCFIMTVTTGQRQFSVQSSFKLNFSPHLIIKAANIKLIETIGQGENYCTQLFEYYNILCL